MGREEGTARARPPESDKLSHAANRCCSGAGCSSCGGEIQLVVVVVSAADLEGRPPLGPELASLAGLRARVALATATNPQGALFRRHPKPLLARQRVLQRSSSASATAAAAARSSSSALCYERPGTVPVAPFTRRSFALNVPRARAPLLQLQRAARGVPSSSSLGLAPRRGRARCAAARPGAASCRGGGGAAARAPACRGTGRTLLVLPLLLLLLVRHGGAAGAPSHLSRAVPFLNCAHWAATLIPALPAARCGVLHYAGALAVIVECLLREDELRHVVCAPTAAAAPCCTGCSGSTRMRGARRRVPAPPRRAAQLVLLGGAVEAVCGRAPPQDGGGGGLRHQHGTCSPRSRLEHFAVGGRLYPVALATAQTRKGRRHFTRCMPAAGQRQQISTVAYTTGSTRPHPPSRLLCNKMPPTLTWPTLPGPVGSGAGGRHSASAAAGERQALELAPS